MVQQSPLGARLHLQLRRFGFRRVTATVEVQARKDHPRRRRVLRRLLRGLAAVQMALVMHDFGRLGDKGWVFGVMLLGWSLMWLCVFIRKRCFLARR